MAVVGSLRSHDRHVFVWQLLTMELMLVQHLALEPSPLVEIEGRACKVSRNSKDRVGVEVDTGSACYLGTSEKRGATEGGTGTSHGGGWLMNSSGYRNLEVPLPPEPDLIFWCPLPCYRPGSGKSPWAQLPCVMWFLPHPYLLPSLIPSRPLSPAASPTTSYSFICPWPGLACS